MPEENYENLDSNQRKPLLSRILAFFSLGLAYPVSIKKQKFYRKPLPTFTDFLFLVFYIWFCSLALKNVEFEYDNIFNLEIPKIRNKNGNYCGEGALSTKPFLVIDFELAQEKNLLCVENCQTTYENVLNICIPKSSGITKTLGFLQELIIITERNLQPITFSILTNFLLCLFFLVLAYFIFSFLLVVVSILFLVSLALISLYLIFQPSVSEASFFVFVENNSQSSRIAGYVFSAITLLSLVILSVSFKSLNKSKKILRKVMKSLTVFPTLFCLSYVFVALELLVILFWCSISLQYLGKRSFILPPFKENTEFYFYHFLFLFWTLQFVHLFFYALAAAITFEMYTDQKYYDFLGIFSVFRWTFTILIMSGTLLFASLLVAIFDAVIAVLNFARRQLSKATGNSGVLLCFAHAIVWCFKGLAEFLSKKGVIFSVVMNTDFLTGMVVGNYLFLKNIGCLALLLGYKGIFIFLTSLITPTLNTALVSWVSYLSKVPDSKNPYFLLIVWVFSYSMTRNFLQIFGASLDSAFLWFSVTEEFGYEGKKIKYFEKKRNKHNVEENVKTQV